MMIGLWWCIVLHMGASVKLFARQPGPRRRPVSRRDAAAAIRDWKPSALSQLDAPGHFIPAEAVWCIGPGGRMHGGVHVLH